MMMMMMMIYNSQFSISDMFRYMITDNNNNMRLVQMKPVQGFFWAKG
jgi:hypothetical protein